MAVFIYCLWEKKQQVKDVQIALQYPGNLNGQVAYWN